MSRWNMLLGALSKILNIVQSMDQALTWVMVPLSAPQKMLEFDQLMEILICEMSKAWNPDAQRIGTRVTRSMANGVGLLPPRLMHANESTLISWKVYEVKGIDFSDETMSENISFRSGDLSTSSLADMAIFSLKYRRIPLEIKYMLNSFVSLVVYTFLRLVPRIIFFLHVPKW